MQVEPMNSVVRKKGEQGQAMAETAIFAVLAVITIFGILALIPFHRTRTAAISATYACAQFLSQSPDPSKATYNARKIAEEILDGDWSATFGAEYQIRVYPPAGRGMPGQCEVQWSAPVLFSGLLGINSGAPTSQVFVSRSEAWKAKWP
ncbi:MAG TPA: hypothetical protein VJ987_07315 [Anaerolineales bacterium]|nr:hypothetical protein [Anaerolineales bacterium]